MAQPPLIVGLDLGTSNCAVSWADPGAGAVVSDFLIPQLVGAGQHAPRPLLPSCVYLPPPSEFTGAAGAPGAPVVGEYARWQGARVPGRLVASSKSWLSFAGVDRTADILPWGAEPGVPRLSPVAAAAELLGHIAASWDAAHPGSPLAAQDLVLTVPASFDEVARSLTVEAARRAGLVRLHLVEEPQAAFCDFVLQQGAELVRLLDGVRSVLVVDVGGGTTDLTLVEVEPAAPGAQPGLRRIAVGEHLMLGGDNMDAALARLAESRLCAGGRRLGPAQWSQLLQACREAKEAFLSPGAPESRRIALAGEGSRLLGNTLSCELLRDEVLPLLLDGFFPRCHAGARPAAPAGSGLREVGLPYARDAAVTRHVSGFLLQHGRLRAPAPGGVASAPPRPDAVLLNGGVFNSPLLVSRLLEVLASWWPDEPPPRLLPHRSFDQAVARGAVAHGLARLGLATRVAGGAARALYVGLGAAEAGAAGRALCVVACGDQEGCVHGIREHPLRLVLGRPVRFPLLAAPDERRDPAGALVDSEGLLPVSPLLATLGEVGAASSLPVHLRSALTELGTLELHCVSQEDESRCWRLEFDLRSAASSAPDGPAAGLPEAATAPLPLRPRLEAAFGPRPTLTEARDLRQLMRLLEQDAGPREDWPLPGLREQWDFLATLQAGRRRSAEHERAWFHLCGFLLRPGFGDPSDAWRCEQVLALLAEGPRQVSDPAVWNEFWILFRRISGGLDEARQLRLWDWLKPHLARRAPLRPAKHLPRPRGVQPEGLEEMVRLAASLEHLPLSEKELLGGWILERLEGPAPVPGPWAWALGRVAARVPLHGGLHRVVPPALASAWLERLLARNLSPEGAPFAAVQVARVSGDRARDLDPALRERTIALLSPAKVPERWIQMLRECVVLDAAETARALGDRLPLGLRLEA